MIIGNGLRLELAQRSLDLCGFHLHRALLLLGSLLRLIVLGLASPATREEEWILYRKSTCLCGPRTSHRHTHRLSSEFREPSSRNHCTIARREIDFRTLPVTCFP